MKDNEEYKTEEPQDSVDNGSEEDIIAEERRQERRRRHKREQVVSTLILLALIAVVSFLVYLGVSALIKYFPRDILTRLRPAAEPTVAVVESTVQESETQITLEAPVVETETEETEVDYLAEVVEKNISGMSLEDKVAGLFIVTPEQLTGASKAQKAGDLTKEALSKYKVGGIVYSENNIGDREQLETLISDTASMCEYPLFFCVEEEGGKYSPVSNSLKDVATAESPGETGSSGDLEQALNAGRSIGSYLKELGFNLDFAPVAELLPGGGDSSEGDEGEKPEEAAEGNSSEGNDEKTTDEKAKPETEDKSENKPDKDADAKTTEDIKDADRYYGSDPEQVSAMVTSAINGLQVEGISSCVKNFPGGTLGAVRTEENVIDKTREEIEKTDLLPFEAAINSGVTAVRMTNERYSAFDGGMVPASLSREAVDGFLRKELGYEGIIITGDLSEKSVSEEFTPGESAVLAIKAGADMIMTPGNLEEAYKEVLSAVQSGDISESDIDASLERIYRVKCSSEVSELYN